MRSAKMAKIAKKTEPEVNAHRSAFSEILASINKKANPGTDRMMGFIAYLIETSIDSKTDSK